MLLNSIRRELGRRRTRAIPTLTAHDDTETALASPRVSTPGRRERAMPMFDAPRGEVATMP